MLFAIFFRRNETWRALRYNQEKDTRPEGRKKEKEQKQRLVNIYFSEPCFSHIFPQLFFLCVRFWFCNFFPGKFNFQLLIHSQLRLKKSFQKI